MFKYVFGEKFLSHIRSLEWFAQLRQNFIWWWWYILWSSNIITHWRNIPTCDKTGSDNQIFYLGILKHLRDGV